MTPGEFLNEFGAVANAPGGVQRLREMILQLAVQGKLVEQNPEDEPASELLKKISKEKAELIKKGKVKKQNQLPEIREDEKPFEIPEGWAWSSLGYVCQRISDGFHHSAKKINDGVLYISATHINDGHINWNSGLSVSEKEYKELFYKAKQRYGDILIVNRGAGCGDAAIVDTNERFCFQNTAIIGFNTSLIISEFMLIMLRSSKARFLKKFVRGGAQPMISNVLLNTHTFGLPPFEEQKQIVSKVDQLMALCDQLEAQQQKRSKLVKYTRISALEALANAQGGEQLQIAWKRVEENLPILFENPEDVEDLKKCVLQNAVMGKLVPQNPDDEPASELLKKIAKEKAELIKKGDIKKQKPLPEIRDDEKPFEIPEGWDWCRIGEVLSIKHGYAFKSNYFKKGSGQYVLTTPGNFFETGGFRDRGNKTKFYDGPTPIDFILNPNDLIIAMTEQAAGLLGSAAFIPDNDKKYLHNQRLGKLITSENFISKGYLFWYFNSPYLRKKVSESSTGMKVKHTSSDKVLIVLIPLPPLAEQHRIVVKTQFLLSLCDTLQKQLAKSRKVAEQLAQSVVESITGISTEKQEKMKVPKTELITRLKLAKKPGAKEHAPLSAILIKNNDELSAKALWNNSGLPIDRFYRQLKIEMVKQDKQTQISKMAKNLDIGEA